MSLLALAHVGFFGQAGPIWALVGFVCFCVVVAILFKIVFAALPALGIKEPWVTVIYWVMVLICFLAFINFAFGWGV